MRKSRAAIVAVSGGFLASSTALGQNAQFEVDAAASSLAVTGTALGSPILTQGPGSLTTTYQGPLFLQLTPTSIAFPGGSEVTANNSGSWQPLPGGDPGSAPANYGGRVVILFSTSLAAVRDAVFDVTTLAPFPLTSTGNSSSFSSSATFTTTSGAIDFNSPLAGSGTQPLAGSTGDNASPNPATLNIAPGTGDSADATLAIPVSFTIVTDLMGLGQGIFNFNGSITARGNARGGDADFDGRVDLDDFNTLASNFGTTSGAGWLRGDFTFDGIVNLNDFNALASNFGLIAAGPAPTPTDWSTLASAVPEPAGATVAGLGALWALRRRQRSR
jgi:hypothetical protein